MSGLQRIYTSVMDSESFGRPEVGELPSGPSWPGEAFWTVSKPCKCAKFGEEGEGPSRRTSEMMPRSWSSADGEETSWTRTKGLSGRLEWEEIQLVGWSQVVKGFESHTKEWNLSEGFLGFFFFVCLFSGRSFWGGKWHQYSALDSVTYFYHDWALGALDSLALRSLDHVIEEYFSSYGVCDSMIQEEYFDDKAQKWLERRNKVEILLRKPV